MSLEWQDHPQGKQAETSLKAYYVIIKQTDADGKETFIMGLHPSEHPEPAREFESEQEAIEAAEESVEYRADPEMVELKRLMRQLQVLTAQKDAATQAVAQVKEQIQKIKSERELREKKPEEKEEEHHEEEEHH